LRYIDRLKGKMPSELSLEDTKDSFGESMPSTSSGGNAAASYGAQAAAGNNPINSSSSSSFTSTTSSNEFHTGLPPAAASSHQPVLKVESDYPANSNAVAAAAAAAAAAAMAFNNSTNTNPTYSSLVDCSTPIPNQYPAYHGAPHLAANAHHMAPHGGANYHSLTSAYPHHGYMQPFFNAQSHLNHLGQPGLYNQSQYDFGNVENASELAAAFHPNIKTEYGTSGSSKRMHNDSDLKEHHTLTLLGSNGSSQIIHGSASAGQLGNSGNNSFSNHNLDTNSETGKLMRLFS
jgi:hypothetical protein